MSMKMPWYSILPAEWTYLEMWAARVFSAFALMAIAPCFALIFFDVILYVWRVVVYEVPIVGGRVRGGQRPRAPSLSERPSGRRRAFSLTGVDYNASRGDANGSKNSSSSSNGSEGGESKAKKRRE